LEQIAEKGDVTGAIKISKYLVHLADKLGNVSIDLGTENNEDGSSQPIQNLK
jgi:hypothetical protein